MSEKQPAILTDVQQIRASVPVPRDRVLEARLAAEKYPFRVPSFYVRHVLTGRPDDPLLEVILPSADESERLPETWEANQRQTDRAVDSTFWIQKYPQEGLIRLATSCSGHCRYCYIQEQTEQRRNPRPDDIDDIFRQLAGPRAFAVREVILSGGDPLTASPRMLARIGTCLHSCNSARLGCGMSAVQLTVHTREPVWRPDYFLNRSSIYRDAFAQLDAYAYVFQVIHSREVTPEFQSLCRLISDTGNRRPLLLNQHPIFKGINADAQILADLYQKLLSGSAPVRPYYAVHPFDSGTLPKHRISLRESQEVMQGVLKLLPGIGVPMLVVPTPKGKAYVSPYEALVRHPESGSYLLVTKNGEQVEYVDRAAKVVEGVPGDCAQSQTNALCMLGSQT